MAAVAKSGTPHVRIASTASSRADSITTFGRHTGFASLAGQAHKLENANVNNSSPRSDGVNSNARSGSSLSSKPSFARKKNASASAEGGESESRWGANFWVTLVEPQTQTPFYACPATGEVSWDPPVGNFVLPPSPEGEWWELSDDSRGGIPYYYHTKTNETVWDRPDAFVIPLTILQNNALGKRLSLVDMSKLSEAFENHPAAQAAAGALRQSTVFPDAETYEDLNSVPAIRRSLSFEVPTASTSQEVDSKRAYGRRSSHRRSLSGDQFVLTVPTGLRDQDYITLRQPLPTIPGSPHVTDRSNTPSRHSISVSAPASPVSDRSKSYKGKGREMPDSPSPSPLGKSSSSISSPLSTHARKGQEDVAFSGSGSGSGSTPPRLKTRSPSYHQNAKPHIQQSLDAAAESFLDINPRVSSSQDDHHKPHSSVSLSLSSPPRSRPDIRRGGDSSGQTVTSSISLSQGGIGGSSSGFSNLFLTADNLPTTPKASNMDFAQKEGGEALNFLQLQNDGTIQKKERLNLKIPPQQARKIPPPPGSPNPLALKRIKSTASKVAGKNISTPILDIETTENMSPSKARAEGKPILLEPAPRSASTASLISGPFSAGDCPSMPHDLVSEIQQFVSSDYAKQYFSTHRTGFIFRRRVPVETLMMWQKPPLNHPLLVLNKSLNKDAVRIFKVIQRLMGDREREKKAYHSDVQSFTQRNASMTSLPPSVSANYEEFRWLLGEGLAHGELRDEVYCQVVKQLRGNPNPESVFRGWQMLCVLLVTFPPSKNFETYLRSFMENRTIQTEGRVDVMAKYCLQRLTVISRKGPRGKPPAIAEIETAGDAAFNPSTFGESLDRVYRLQERTYPKLQVPIILPFLADGILALGGLKQEGIFRIPGDGDDVSALRVRIEKGYYNLENVDDAHVLASLFKLWMRELCDPLIPDELYNDCISCSKDPEACVQMVSRLPTLNRRVVLFVISFLQLFLEEKVQAATKMTSTNLALVMAPNLLRCNSESMTVVFTNAQYEQHFVHNLLLHLKCNKVDTNYIPQHGLGHNPSPFDASTNPKSRSRRS